MIEIAVTILLIRVFLNNSECDNRCLVMAFVPVSDCDYLISTSNFLILNKNFKILPIVYIC